MNKKLSELPINIADLERISTFLAPYYKMTPAEKAAEIRGQINSSQAETNLETSGFIAVATRYANHEAGVDQVRIFLGNHLIGCEVLKIAKPGKNFKKIKMGGR